MIALLGRQPKIGLAELESIFGDVKPIGDNAALIKNNKVKINYLGGTLKLAEELSEIESTDWRKINPQLTKFLLDHIAYLPQGKIKLGISLYGIRANAQQIFRAGLELKKAVRKSGRSLRFIPSNGSVLNSAQVLHNQLTKENGIELCLIKNGQTTIIAKTTAVQDIDDYSRRDYGRPKRDAFVGMLPPKLAQIMVNLATQGHPETILDPFCGTGVVLQEALLTGNKVLGSDLNPKMIDYTSENLQWLQKTYPDVGVPASLEVADATSAKWPKFTSVVSETYLGQPLSGLPSPQKLAEIIRSCNTITEKFLKNLRPQLKPGSRHCIAVPAWSVGDKFKHLPALDHLESLGYNRVRFQHSSNDDLVYHRQGQVVARELLVLLVKE